MMKLKHDTALDSCRFLPLTSKLKVIIGSFSKFASSYLELIILSMRARCEVGQNDGAEGGVRVKVARLGDPLGREY